MAGPCGAPDRSPRCSLRPVASGAAAPRRAARMHAARTGQGGLMSAYQRAVPVLQVVNVETSLRWYVDVLGLMADTFPKTAPYSFAMLRRDSAEIMLQCADETRAEGSSARKPDPE